MTAITPVIATAVLGLAGMEAVIAFDLFSFVASVYEAAFPAMLLPRDGGSEKVLGMVNTVVGVSTLTGSLPVFQA